MNVKYENDIAIVRLDYLKDIRESNQFVTECLALIPRGTRALILDLQDVPVTDSILNGVVALLTRSYRESGGRVVLCDVSEGVHRVFEIFHMKGLLEIAPTRADALALLSPTATSAPG